LSLIKRLGRRIPPLRWCALQYAHQARQRQAEARWQQVQATLALLGNVVIAWAGIERMLDELIAWYQHARTDLSKEHPRSLSRKLVYLRLMEKDGEFTAQTRDFLRQTRVTAKRLGDERHNLIHGLLHRLPTTDAQWRTQRVKYEGPYAMLVHASYKPDDLTRVQGEISDFAHDLSPKIWVIIRGDTRHISASDLAKAQMDLGIA
jgi:hypothetical protein